MTSKQTRPIGRSGGKRTVSQHTRADGQKQSANRLGGRFDMKAGAQSGAATDVFESLEDRLARQQREVEETKNLIRSRDYIESLRGIPQVKRLDLTLTCIDADKSEDVEYRRRAHTSRSILRLHEEQPDVVAWTARIDSEGRGYATLTGVEVYDGTHRDVVPGDQWSRSWHTSGSDIAVADTGAIDDGATVSLWIDAQNAEAALDTDSEGFGYEKWKIDSPKTSTRTNGR